MTRVTPNYYLYTYQHSFARDESLNELAGQLRLVEIWDDLPPDWQGTVMDAASYAESTITLETARQQASAQLEIYDTGDSDPSADPPRFPTGPQRAARHSINVTAQTIRRLRQLEAEREELGVLKAKASVGLALIDCLLSWNQANLYIMERQHRLAAGHYAECQKKMTVYFAQRYPGQCSVADTQDEAYRQLQRLAQRLLKSGGNVKKHFDNRKEKGKLEDLSNVDWVQPAAPASFGQSVYNNAKKLLRALGWETAGQNQAEKDALKEELETKIDAPLLTIGLVFAQLGYAECLRMRRVFRDAALAYGNLVSGYSDNCLNEAIEVPYVKLVKGQVQLTLANNAYKAQRVFDARQYYKQVFELFQNQGGYLSQVEAGTRRFEQQIDTLLTKSFHPLAVREALQGSPLPPLLTDKERQHLDALGKEVPIETVSPARRGLSWSERLTDPLQALLHFQSETETDPAVFALICEAKARLIQIGAGLNYLGYHEDYAPPWRFQFLLDRARYFAEQTKAAQRDYLNFLGKAESEEYVEDGVAQTVMLEKSNVGVENARVEQNRNEVETAKEGKELADLTARNADKHVQDYREFDQRAAAAANQSFWGGVVSTVGSTLSGAVSGALSPKGPVLGGISGGLGGLLGGIGGAISGAAQADVEAEQRQLELANLKRTMQEAAKSAQVAAAQLEVTKAGLVIATLQSATALLRHDFAVQNLNFLREGRTLNAETWQRLTELMQTISEVYLRYAVEIAFLTEQAYEFEVDEKINVIRYDYDVDNTEGMLAGDFLLQDLNKLEHNLIVTQRLRQQHVRYVVSLAREFPAALQQLRETGSTIFTLDLQRLETRFKGLYNLRVGSVAVQPVALMDPTRFSLQLTHLGTDQVRLGGRADRRSEQRWTHVVTSTLQSNTSNNLLLFYDGEARVAEFYTFDDPGALVLLKRHDDWLKSWTHIVGLRLGKTDNPHALFFWNLEARAGEFHTVDEQGNLSLLTRYRWSSKGWTHIVAIRLKSGGPHTLLFYDRDAGVGEFHAVDEHGNLMLLKQHEGWRKSWTHILTVGGFHGNVEKLLFYDRDAGVGEFHAVDEHGNLMLLKQHEGWRKSWTHIIGLGEPALFYDAEAGVVEAYTIDDHGNLSPITRYEGWRKSWTHLVGGEFGGGGDTADYLFYDRDAGLAEFYSGTGTGYLDLANTHKAASYFLKSWLPSVDAEWPVRVRSRGPETVLFSGLVRGDERETFSFMATNERNAFEGLAAAASWRIDMSMRENQVDPGTMADVLLSIDISGYYDPTLRRAIEAAPRIPSVLTKYLSAQQTFPDAFYEFQQTGTLELPVTSDMLTLDTPVGRLRNAGIILVPSTKMPHFNNLMSIYAVEFEVTKKGGNRELKILNDIPKLAFRFLDQRKLEAQVSGVPPTSVSWDFGDGSDWKQGDGHQHQYSRPGKYRVVLRVVNNGRLHDYEADVVVSDLPQGKVQPPLTAYPALSLDAGGKVVAQAQTTEEVSTFWRLFGQPNEQNRPAAETYDPSQPMDLGPGKYILIFASTRKLSAHIHGRQRYLPSKTVAINGLRIASNRMFDDAGEEIKTDTRNELAKHLFEGGEISPVDRWTLELPVSDADNAFLRTVTSDDDVQFDLSAIEEVVLTLEYETGEQPSLPLPEPREGDISAALSPLFVDGGYASW